MTALDDRLAQPLADVVDDGFCARVTQSVAAMQRRNTLWTVAGAVAGAGILLSVMPLGEAGGAVEKLSLEVGSSLPIAIAFSILVLSNSLARWLAE